MQIEKADAARRFRYAAWRLHLVRFAAHMIEPEGRNELGPALMNVTAARSFRSGESIMWRKVVRHPIGTPLARCVQPLDGFFASPQQRMLDERRSVAHTLPPRMSSRETRHPSRHAREEPLTRLEKVNATRSR